MGKSESQAPRHPQDAPQTPSLQARIPRTSLEGNPRESQDHWTNQKRFNEEPKWQDRVQDCPQSRNEGLQEERTQQVDQGFHAGAKELEDQGIPGLQEGN